MTLYRYNKSDQGTFGFLVYDDKALHTLELPDKGNKPNISCIPEGTYKVTKRYSPHFKKELYWLNNVPNRSFILIHSANFAGDTSKGWQSQLQGCIALGKKIGSFPNKFGKVQKAILNSNLAIREFYEDMDDEFEITIKDLIC